MQLLIAGGTGDIGQAAVREAISVGHQGTELVREDTSAAASALAPASR